MTPRLLFVAVVPVLVLVSAISARAEPFAFSTLPATSSTELLNDGAWAFGFRPAEDIRINTVWLPADFVATDEDARFNIHLYAADDELPGATLAFHHHAGIQAGPQLLQLRLNATTHLVADTLYFLVYASDDPFVVRLSFGSAGSTGPFAWVGEFGDFRSIEPWSATPAFALSLEGTDPYREGT